MLKVLFRITIIAAILAGVGLGFKPAKQYWEERNRPKFRTAEVTEGKLISVVNATGTVQPVLSIQIGSFVSGPIVELNVDFNDEVKKDQVLAKIDPRIYVAAVARDQAAKAIAEAEVERVHALLQQSKNDEKRALALRDQNEDYISDTELDQFRFSRMSMEAQLKVAEASVLQATANLENSTANYEYTEITAPEDGIVIDRKIDPGQTLAASFQTPELFIIAPNMKEKMHIFADVDEADIGMIRSAKEAGQPVRFTVDAYPDDLFEGMIEQIRYSSATTENVVTYPVVIAAPNPDLKLLPGMTASISFQLDEVDHCTKVPNSALRFYPKKEHVREEDHKVLDGASQEDEEDRDSDVVLSASEKAEANRKRNIRHVWVLEEHKLKAIEITIGLNDNRFTELAEGDLKIGQELVIGLKLDDD